MYIDTALTPQEVADILKISKSTVYELIKRKDINSYRVGKKVRVDLKDVEAYKNKTRKIKENISNDTASTINESNPILYNTESQRKESLKKYSLVVCGQDVVLDILCRYLACHEDGIRALRSYESSYNGIYELYRGKIEVATAHMWDGKTGQYNVSYVEKMLPGTSAVVIRLVGRMQGFYVAKGNPKKIKNWDDFKRPDITIINRERGSGTRILLDEHLRQMNIVGNEIKGYSRESISHLAVASVVARGGADLGIGNEKSCSQVENIDFIPIQQEKYDMIIKKQDMNKPEIKAIMKIVQSQEFKLEILGIGGYDVSEMGKIIAET